MLRTCTYEAAAAYLAIAAGTLRNLVSKGKGPASIKIGRARRFRVDDLDAWLAAHRDETQAPRRRPGRPRKGESRQ